MTVQHTLRVLVVCAANQCRSRLAETLLRDALADVSVEVRSAGTRVDGPAPMCIEVQTFLASQQVATDAQRPSVEINTAMLQAADLVLAADSQVRADIVRIDPDVRRKLFLLRPAGIAAELLMRQDLVRLAHGAFLDGRPTLDEVVDGELSVIARALDPLDRTGWLSEELAIAQTQAGPLLTADVADAHESTRSNHADTLHAVANAVRQLTGLLRQLSQLTP